MSNFEVSSSDNLNGIAILMLLMQYINPSSPHLYTKNYASTILEIYFSKHLLLKIIIIHIKFLFSTIKFLKKFTFLFSTILLKKVNLYKRFFKISSTSKIIWAIQHMLKQNLKITFSPLCLEHRIESSRYLLLYVNIFYYVYVLCICICNYIMYIFTPYI